MKRLLPAALALFLAGTLTACHASETSTQSPATPTTSPTPYKGLVASTQTAEQAEKERQHQAILDLQKADSTFALLSEEEIADLLNSTCNLISSYLETKIKKSEEIRGEEIIMLLRDIKDRNAGKNFEFAPYLKAALNGFCPAFKDHIDPLK